MTVSSSINKHIYAGNGVATQFPYSFTLLDADHIKVYLTNASLVVSEITADFYVNEAEGYVEYPGYETGTAPPAEEQPPVLPTGWKITIVRDVPLTQEIDLVNSGSYAPEVLEGGYDYAMMAIQQLSEGLDRAAQLPIDSTPGSGSSAIADIIALATAASNSASNANASAIAAAASAATALEQVPLVEAEGDAQIVLVQSEGTTQVGLVQAEGTTQIGLVEDEGTAQLILIDAQLSIAEASATTATTQAGLASGFASSASDSKDAAALSESNAADSEDNALSYAEAAAVSAANANMATAAAYNPATSYDYPTVVAFTDGSTYRCIGTDVVGEDPDTSSNWIKIAVVQADFFEPDALGDLMPAITPFYSNDFEIDVNGDIMPNA